jgi:hypothetical protein
LYNYNTIESNCKPDSETLILSKRQKLSLLASDLTDLVQSLLLLSAFESEFLLLLTSTKVSIQQAI